ncbi:hypothetical protein NW762_012899 [Fusarium torreyae]|uniref:Uncharacterized protein n=1 Tax=Fusarium torreyae TaxID=1237075 RepID=A0A9W8RN66_9HYPO|nr:hypothetical protein NW762_012899 [Fusarium torreyae]
MHETKDSHPTSSRLHQGAHHILLEWQQESIQFFIQTSGYELLKTNEMLHHRSPAVVMKNQKNAPSAIDTSSDHEHMGSQRPQK